LLILTPANLLAQDTEPVSLRPKWVEGQTSRYEVWSSRTQQATVSLAGQSRSTSLEMVSLGEVQWTVDKVKADGSAQCTMTLDWLTLEYTPEGEKALVNDSRKGTGDIEPYHALLKAITGVPIKITVAPDGTVTKAQGMKAMAAKIKSDYKDMIPEELDFIETATDLAALVAAPESIDVGKNWKTKLKWTWSDAPFKGYMHHDQTYTLSSIEDVDGLPLAIIDGQSKLKLELDRSDLPEGMPPFDVKLVKGDLQTQVMFDLSRNEAVGRNSIQTTTLDITIRTPNTTITRRVQETLQTQVLRIEEE
tara:strand:- start:871 stop:1788 length:918 start_codon:yes stop_codon:yes gene_type:complete